MKKVFTLLSAIVCLSGLNAQNAQFRDPYNKTFIQNIQRLPNQQLQDDLRDQKAWTDFQAAHGDWYVEFKEETGTPHRAFGKPIAVSGATPEAMALNFLQTYCKDFISETQNLVLAKSVASEKYNYVTFTQQYAGLDVLWSEVTVRLSLDGKVVMFGIDVYNNITLSTTPSIAPESISAAAVADFTIPVTGTVVAPELKVLPIPGAQGLEYKLVYEVEVNTMGYDNIPGNYYSLVDANNGRVYYRKNMVHTCGEYMMTANIQINSEITDNPLLPTVNRGLPYLRVVVDGDVYYTDENGFLTLNSITTPTPATIDLRGLYARVYQGAGGADMESISVTVFPGDNTFEFDDLSGSVPSEASAYYWQNIVHDKMKAYFPTFTGLDIDQTIRVERNDGTCNAFYDGTSTNFYQAGGGCPATGLFNDVVMHEYGHGINYDLYAGLGDPGGMGNGAMQEGYADLWGIVVTDNPILGQGFLGGAGTFVRRYDVEPKVYPQDLVGEVHADGEIIAGAWWDVNENLGADLVSMTDLWMETHNATVDGADGNEGEIFRDVLLEALIADDDNADLTDGTPNEDAITEAFCEHGITLIGNISMDHAEFAEPVAYDAPLTISATLDVDYPEYLGAAQLYYRTTPGADYVETDMTNVGGTDYEAEIPAQPQGTIIEYYFKVGDTNGCGSVTMPAKADLEVEPNLPYFALVGFEMVDFEDFDNEFGSWEVDPDGTDDATTGQWDVNTPIASVDANGYEVQTGEDHTDGPGNLCAFTGNAGAGDGVGTNDVDGGMTTIRSPYFNLTSYTDPVFTYYRRYSNASPTSANPGNDVWEVYITDNGGDDWVRVERTHTEDNTWRRNTVRVTDFVDITSEVAFLFVAEDSIVVDDPSGFLGGSLIEAAVDDLFLYDLGEVVVDTTEDTTGQTSVELADLFAGIFPNPANEKCTIFFGDFTGDVDVIISNAVGEIMLTERISVAPNASYSIDTRNLAQGIYTITLRSDNAIENKRVIIQH